MIDLNADVGEGIPDEGSLYRFITSCSIACGGHCGDRRSMAAAVAFALDHGLRIGAHPAYPDRKHFGRTNLEISDAELRSSLSEQLAELQDVVDAAGGTLAYVKPHGALYHRISVDRDVAELLLEVVAAVDPSLQIMAMASSPVHQWAADLGVGSIHEAFADRRYVGASSLAGRDRPDALISDPDQAAEQARRIATGRPLIVESGEEINVIAQSLCVHGDSPNAVEIARAVRAALEDSHE